MREQSENTENADFIPYIEIIIENIYNYSGIFITAIFHSVLGFFISIFLIKDLIQSDILFRSSSFGHLPMSARTIKCLCC